MHFDDFDDLEEEAFFGCPERAPHPGVAAVLSVLVPGLGQVYNGRLIRGALWFLVTSFGYWAILVPGFLLHALAVYCAYDGARRWRGYRCRGESIHGVYRGRRRRA